MSMEDTIKEWAGEGEIVALHEFNRLGATIGVVARDDGFYDMIRAFTIGDRIEVSMDVQAGSAGDVFVRLMDIVD
jgi:hypothetical protein